MSDEAEYVEEEESEEPVEEGAPAWTTTFGDLMSLLLTFFILLYSMSELKMERFILASDSLSNAMSGTAVIEDPTPTGPVPSPRPAVMRPDGAPATPSQIPFEKSPAMEAQRELDRIAARLREFIEENGLEKDLSVLSTEEGVHLRILSNALFASGSGIMEPSSRWIFPYLAEITSTVMVPAVVSGHADNAPIQTPFFPSNWELSAVRAAGVARELVENGHDPFKVRVESFGDQRPVASNDTPEGRATNRRVEILFRRVDLMSLNLEPDLPAPLQ